MEKRRITISMEEADDLLREAFDNSYRVFFEGLSVKELMRECKSEGRDMFVTFYVEDGPEESDMYDMLLWYEDEEWYERCARIRDYIRTSFPKKGK